MIEELTALDGQGAILGFHCAEAATLGAGLLGTQATSLLLKEDRQGAFGQASRCCYGNLLHRRQIYSEVRSFLSEGPASDNFSPASDEVGDLPQFLRRHLARRHLKTSLTLAPVWLGVLLLPFYYMPLCIAKRVLASDPPCGSYAP